jgi:hypothetical protein
MTSLLRTVATAKKTDTRIQYVGGPYYTDVQTAKKTLFPFTFKNGQLDISTKTGFVLDSGNKPLNGNGGFQVSLLGGLDLVQTIGPNFKEFVYNCTWGEDSSWDVTSITSIKVYSPGVITKVQQLNPDALPLNIDPNGDATVVSSYPPGEFVAGGVNYGTAFVFERPLVLSLNTVGHGTQYITFYTSWDR